jgi:hypothetical protein
MKQRLLGIVELTLSEVKECLWEQALEDKSLLHTAVKKYLLKHHGYELKNLDLAHFQDGVVIKAEVESSKLASRDQGPHEQAISSGFKKKNIGFYKALSSFLQDVNKKGNKSVTFDSALEKMQSIYPSLTRRNFTIYIMDKRQQKLKGFQYDSGKRVLRVQAPLI